MSHPVKIVEVGPRDGLQNESMALSPATRIAFIEWLIAAGLRNIEVGSFVSPKWVPQMAHSAEVLGSIVSRYEGNFPVLVPNSRGLSEAIDAGAREIAVFAAASESFSLKNINCSIAHSLERYRPVVEQATTSGVRVRGYVSCVMGCPYEGEIPPKSVVSVTQKLLEFGCYEVSLGDTIGVGTPNMTRALLDAILQECEPNQVAVHFHDTHGRALANLSVALDRGVSTIDASAGGLGGCPYAPGASGNVATEAVVDLLEGQGISTGVDRAALGGAVDFILRQLGRCPRASRNLSTEL